MEYLDRAGELFSHFGVADALGVSPARLVDDGHSA